LLLIYSSLSIAGCALLLLPVTVISHDILLAWPAEPYIARLKRETIPQMWWIIFTATSSSLYLILPFAYFHLETSKYIYSDTKLALSSERMLAETLKQWTYFRKIVFFNTDVPELSTFSYSLFTAFGSLIVMVCLPRGFEILASYGWQLIEPDKPYDGTHLDIINNAINYKLNSPEERSYYNNSVNLSKYDDKLTEKIQMKKLEQKFVKYSITYNVFKRGVWKICGGMLILINMIFPFLICIRAAWGILIQFFFGLQDQGLYDFLNPNPHHDTGLFNTFIDLFLIIYISVSAIVGYYNMESLSPIHPKIKDTPISLILLNTFIIIIICSSLPGVARILGVLRFELMGNFETMFYLINTNYLLLYKSSFIFIFASKYLQIFPFWKRLITLLATKVQKKIISIITHYLHYPK